MWVVEIDEVVAVEISKIRYFFVVVVVAAVVAFVFVRLKFIKSFRWSAFYRQ